ncbi:hypothetical protein [Corynebacterium sp.]|uniref:hypothetical protein n=1 Tax=Corynebacterium sp. TaxID=1720 RepID=UPI002A90A394|nr:hypothetical protein [Corynebacterium sp.]MDY5786320.1 hypothetical protein [Corynebacterium sp.]
MDNYEPVRDADAADAVEDYYAGAASYDRETVRFFDVAHEGAQIRAVANAVGDLARLRGLAPRSVVVVATDQVSRAAAEAALRLREPLPLPVVVTTVLPDYVGPLDVVAVIGECTSDPYTGQDTRSLLTAVRRGAETILAGPHRGAILDDAPEGVITVPALPSAAGASPLRTMALVWAILDCLDQPEELTREFLDAVANDVDEELEALSPQRDTTVNAARQLREFASGARVLHTGFSPAGDAVASLAAQIWTARGIASGYATRAEAGRALEDAQAEQAVTDIFHDPFLDSEPGLVPLKAVVWAEPETVLPASRAEAVPSTSLGDAASAARLVARAFAATAMSD